MILDAVDGTLGWPRLLGNTNMSRTDVGTRPGLIVLFILAHRMLRGPVVAD
jgi:hypothetical protein